MMLSNAFTCTGSYAILILYGIKRTENRSAWPEPREGRAAISCSKSFCKEEYGQFIAWASVNLPPEDFEKLPSWREVKDWPGKVVGVCDYKASHQPTNQPTNKPTISRGEGLARQGRRRVRLQGKPPTNQSINHILGRRLSVLVGLVERRAPARSDSLPRQRRHVVAPAIHRPIGS